MKIKKVTQNYILVALLAAGSLVEVVSGFVLWFALPHGTGRLGIDREFWSLSRTAWVNLHDWAAIALIAIAALHIIMHWKWIVHMSARYFQIPGRKEVKAIPVRAESTQG